jgi:hypothetical protein
VIHASGPANRRLAVRSIRCGRARRGPAPVAAAAVCCLVGAGLAGCPSQNSSLPYTPYTGVNFSPETLLQGVGCGTACGQVFKYVVVVGDPSDAAAPALSPLADGAPGAYASLSACNTYTVFSSLASSLDGGPTLEAWIYAYDEADFLAAQSFVPGFASCGQPTCVLSLADMQTIVRTYSTYTTTCMATPETGDNVQASCLPLVSAASRDAASDSAAVASGPDCGATDGDTMLDE